jgi:hypothetical protein
MRHRRINRRAALTILFCIYNYCRKHATLKGLAPAMAHGIAGHARTVKEMLQNVVA